jgi:uncharacterized membrane protein
MEETAHLWALGFDDMERAARVRDEIAGLADRHCLSLSDTAVAVRYADGSTTLDGEPVAAPVKLRGSGIAGWFAALALGAPPLTPAAVSSVLRGAGCATSTLIRKEEDFLRAVDGMLKPGTSALFVLGLMTDADKFLAGIRGLGGTVLKASVDVEAVKRIQSALSAAGGNG